MDDSEEEGDEEYEWNDNPIEAAEINCLDIHEAAHHAHNEDVIQHHEPWESWLEP